MHRARVSLLRLGGQQPWDEARIETTHSAPAVTEAEQRGCRAPGAGAKSPLLTTTTPARRLGNLLPTAFLDRRLPSAAGRFSVSALANSHQLTPGSGCGSSWCGAVTPPFSGSLAGATPWPRRRRRWMSTATLDPLRRRPRGCRLGCGGGMRPLSRGWRPTSGTGRLSPSARAGRCGDRPTVAGDVRASRARSRGGGQSTRFNGPGWGALPSPWGEVGDNRRVSPFQAPPSLAPAEYLLPPLSLPSSPLSLPGGFASGTRCERERSAPPWK